MILNNGKNIIELSKEFENFDRYYMFKEIIDKSIKDEDVIELFNENKDGDIIGLFMLMKIKNISLSEKQKNKLAKISMHQANILNLGSNTNVLNKSSYLLFNELPLEIYEIEVRDQVTGFFETLKDKKKINIIYKKLSDRERAKKLSEDLNAVKKTTNSYNKVKI